MSVDSRGRRASDGVRAATEGVNVMAQLTELQHQDKARRRDGILVAVGVAVLIVVGAGLGVNALVRDAHEAVPATPPTTTSSSAPQLLTYGSGGVDDLGVGITKPSQVDQLTGAPDDFKSFVAGLVTELSKDASCPDAFHGITVEKVRTDGFAVGGVNSCGGYLALWATVNGTWKEIEGAQEMWDCAVLKKYAVPSDIAGQQCYDYSGTNKVEPYDQS